MVVDHLRLQLDIGVWPYIAYIAWPTAPAILAELFGTTNAFERLYLEEMIATYFEYSETQCLSHIVTF